MLGDNPINLTPPKPAPPLSPEQVVELTHHANRIFDSGGLRRLTDRQSWIDFCLQRAEQHVITGD